MAEKESVSPSKSATSEVLILDWEFVKESLRRHSASIVAFPHFGAGLPLNLPQPHVVLEREATDEETKQDTDEVEKFSVEFLWGDDEKVKDVKIAGSWDEWKVWQMTKGESTLNEQIGREITDSLMICLDGLWRKVLRLEVGRYDFKFVVDGEWKVSGYHKTATGEDGKDSKNVREVCKPGALENHDENAAEGKGKRMKCARCIIA